MKFLLYFCCLSIVCGIGFAGCGSKHYKNIPHDSIGFQAKADAESDAQRDVNMLAYFGSGVSATFTAAMCGLMTGCLADSTFGWQDDPSYMIASMSAAGAFILLIQYYIRPSNPPPERLIGKSPEYVKFYADAYRTKIGSYQIKSVAAGSIFGCLTLTTGGVLIIRGHIVGGSETP